MENILVGKRLQKIRQEAKLSYVAMAELLDISEGQYRKIERGIYGLDVKKIIMLYEKMNIDPLYLLTGKIGDVDIEHSSNTGKSVNKNSLVCELLDYCKNQLKDMGDK